MLCGINFGYSTEDKIFDETGSLQQAEEKSYFSDVAVNKSQFRKRILRTFSLWGVPLQTDGDKVSAFERAIFQTNWLDTQTNNAEGIGSKKLVESSDGLLCSELHPADKGFCSVGACYCCCFNSRIKLSAIALMLVVDMLIP